MIIIKTPCDNINSGRLSNYPLPCYDCMLEHNPEGESEIRAAEVKAKAKIKKYLASDAYKAECRLAKYGRGYNPEENEHDEHDEGATD